MAKMNYGNFKEESNGDNVYRYSKADLGRGGAGSTRKCEPVHASREYLEELLERYRNYAKILRDEGNIDAAKAGIISADIALYLIQTDLNSATV